MKKIPLTKGKFTLVDNEDHEKLSKVSWSFHRTGYASGWVNGKWQMMHRVILNPPKDKKVDHINHDKLDNCKSNLRVCTQFENCQNRKVRGSVTFHKNRIRKNWQARLGINYKRISLGYYNSSHEARIAVNNYIMKGA